MSDHSHNINAVLRPTIFREYIGVKDDPETLDDFPVNIINDDVNQFHFILGFATEVYKDGKGTGHFVRDWNFDYFSPEKVFKHKKEHKNMKVMITIGGHGTKYPFNPKEKKVWIFNAISSIRHIIQDYENYLVNDDSGSCHCTSIIDGIDINYEYIDSSVTGADFSNCIGQVIKHLKKDKHVSKSMEYVSIAPTELLQAHYHKLFWDHKMDINYVDYKFYNQTISSKDEFDDLYNQLITDYGELKLLAGVSTDPADTKMNREVFIEGVTRLINSKSLLGLFVWSANDSANPPSNDIEPYILEEMLQDLLTNN
jgi:hypothetical protein